MGRSPKPLRLLVHPSNHLYLPCQPILRHGSNQALLVKSKLHTHASMSLAGTVPSGHPRRTLLLIPIRASRGEAPLIPRR